MTRAALAALADHGFTPAAIVARQTYRSAPAIRGALAAGLRGGGSRFLGVPEDCGRFLHDVLTPAGRSTPKASTICRCPRPVAPDHYVPEPLDS